MQGEKFLNGGDSKVPFRVRFLEALDAKAFDADLRRHLRKVGKRHEWQGAVAGAFEAYGRVMSRHETSADAFLNDPASTLDGTREWLRGQGFRGVGRIRLRARLTPDGDLSVAFDPAFLDQSGAWQRAEEWDMRRLDPAPPGGRPPNEVLHVRGGAALFDRPGIDPLFWDAWELSRSYAAEAVHQAYRAVVARLSRRFDLQEDRAVVALMEETSPGRGPISSLELVDGLAEFRAWVAGTPGRFLAETGLDPAGFHALCEGHHVGAGGLWRASKVSREVRRLAPGAFEMTPGACREWHADLSRAVRYGLWDPAAPAAVMDGDAVPVPPPPPPTEPDEHVRALAAHREARAAVRSGEVPRTDHRLWGAAIYPARGIGLPDEVREEFGVDGPHALVEALNDLRWSRGERPIPQGDFPTNKANLSKVVRMLRELREEADPGPSPVSP